MLYRLFFFFLFATAVFSLDAGFNAPSRIDVSDRRDYFFTVDFLYWQPCQDDMFIATATPDPSFINSNTDLIEQEFKWHPGFKASFGVNFDVDHWYALAEYTWFHNDQRITTFAPNGSTGRLDLLWPVQTTGVNSVTSFTSSWDLGLDFVDLLLARSYFVGEQLTFDTFLGARFGLLNQKLTINYVEDSAVTSPANARFRTSAWELGPKLGVNTNWIIGEGFRVVGKVFSDLTYTRYRKIRNDQDEVSTSSNPGVSMRADTFSVRPHFETGAGFGWGSYIKGCNYHVDIEASYDFQVFFSQNMLHILSTATLSNLAIPTNLYIQGLTLKGRLDF